MKIFNEHKNLVFDTTDKIIQRITNKKIFQSKRIQNLDDFFIIHRGNLKAIDPSQIIKDPLNIIKAFNLHRTTKLKFLMMF